jgi:Uma2 family endonuclease
MYEPVPPLQSGDRLSRHEFERRYQLMPPNVKAELIEGIVYMPSPVRATNHARPHALIMAWLGAYWFATPGVDLFDNATLRLDLDNEPQPDAALCIDPARGGQARIGEDDYLEGAPELVVEVAASSAAYDTGDKLKVYRRNGVAEYLIWTIYERRLDWWRLSEGRYVPLPIDADGVIRSRVFPGLYLHVASLLAEERRTVLAILQQGLASPEHTAFVKRLGADQ